MNLFLYRHHDMVPWDTDIDIGIPAQFEEVIRNYSITRQEISDRRVRIVNWIK